MNRIIMSEEIELSAGAGGGSKKKRPRSLANRASINLRNDGLVFCAICYGTVTFSAW